MKPLTLHISHTFTARSSIVIALVILLPCSSAARKVEEVGHIKGPTDPNRVLVLDGSNVHNVGELQMHVGNWGELGSRPDTGAPFSWGPSAQWPAGSSIEYLFTAGLWVGALSLGVPAVSTAAFEREFRPSQDRRDIIYRTSEGSEGGNRKPRSDADDDKDGAVDEEWLDGFDDDGDGLVDEDFAAISRLMFACRYTDDQPISREIYPQHNPLGIMVRQQSYQWSAARYDDFIGVEYHITNISDNILEEVYIGMFIDGDAGHRDRSNYWEDDLTARVFVPVVCTNLGPVQFDFAYTYDADGDDGQTPGYFGIAVFDHDTDVDGLTAPTNVGFSTYAHFAGRQTFSQGGDPTNDFERYELLSQRRIEPNPTLPRDYRILVSIGPFAELLPDSTLVAQFAFAVGAGNDALTNVASAKIAYNGGWFDWDDDKWTGIQGRETLVHGPAQSVWEDKCRKFTRVEQGCDWQRLDTRFAKPIPILHEGESAWSNADCEFECLFKGACGYAEHDSLVFRTGVAGRETQVHWIMDAAPPPPSIRIDDHARAGVVVYWDNSSENVSDNVTQLFDFEGYQVWRADDWRRPLGTSEATGPPTDLWHALTQADVINAFGEDVGLAKLRYEPLTHLLSPLQKRDYLNTISQHLVSFPDKEPPCPPGVTDEICDTLKAMARLELGLTGGRRYYRYVDRTAHLGRPYFYSVVAFDHGVDENGGIIAGIAGVPGSNFQFVEPKSVAQMPYEYLEREVYVVPNPVTRESMDAWTLAPTNDDPTGTKVEFRNLPGAAGIIRIYTLAGDLVQELRFDGRNGVGTLEWDLVSRNGQDITSGVYIFSIDSDGGQFDRTIGKFTVIR